MGYSYLTEDRRLAQGSAPPSGAPVPFDVVVLAAQEYQREYEPGSTVSEVVRVPLDDARPTVSERLRIHAAARDVARRVRAGQRVLVTCMAGRNRSGVIAGLALAELGLPGAVAARRIQRIRNGLTNPHFFEMVVRSGA